MKHVIFSAVAALFLLGANANAMTFEQAQEKVLNGLEEQGYLSGLSNQEIKVVENLVTTEVAKEFANSDSLNLSEEAQQAFLLDTIKSVGEKIVSGVKAIGSAAAGIVKSAVANIGPLLVKVGPKLMALAEKAKELAPVAEKLAKAAGVDPKIIQGALSLLSKAEQAQALLGGDKAAELLKKGMELASRL